MKRVFLQAFGCQMNRLDGEIVLGELAREGYHETHDPDEADVVLYNTCSVRAHAEDKVWSHLGQLRARKQGQRDLVIGVMGCMAQACADEIRRRIKVHSTNRDNFQVRQGR